MDSSVRPTLGSAALSSSRVSQECDIQLRARAGDTDHKWRCSSFSNDCRLPKQPKLRAGKSNERGAASEEGVNCAPDYRLCTPKQTDVSDSAGPTSTASELSICSWNQFIRHSQFVRYSGQFARACRAIHGAAQGNTKRLAGSLLSIRDHASGRTRKIWSERPNFPLPTTSLAGVQASVPEILAPLLD